MNSLVSIVIPFYNRKEYTRIMVESIVSQTYKNWELLMVDDGCQDGSAALIKMYEKKDNRIKYYRRQDYSSVKGACSSRNVGLYMAKGDYIIFFDSDDWVPEDCIENRVSFMKGHADLDFSVFPLYFYKSVDIKSGASIGGINTGENDYFNFIMRNLPFTVVCNIFKRDILLSNNIYWDEQLLSIQDADFNIQCIERGLKYDYCKCAGINYYVRMHNNDNSVSRSVLKQEQIESHKHYIKKRFQNNATCQPTSLYRLYFLIASFVNMLFQNRKAVSEILQMIKHKPLLYHILKVKSCCAYFVYNLGFSKRVCIWLFFSGIPFYYSKSAKIRNKQSISIYNKSRNTVIKIKDTMI